MAFDYMFYLGYPFMIVFVIVIISTICFIVFRGLYFTFNKSFKWFLKYSIMRNKIDPIAVISIEKNKELTPEKYKLLVLEQTNNMNKAREYTYLFKKINRADKEVK